MLVVLPLDEKKAIVNSCYMLDLGSYLIERIKLLNNTAVCAKSFPSEHVQIFTLD